MTEPATNDKPGDFFDTLKQAELYIPGLTGANLFTALPDVSTTPNVTLPSLSKAISQGRSNDDFTLSATCLLKTVYQEKAYLPGKVVL